MIQFVIHVEPKPQQQTRFFRRGTKMVPYNPSNPYLEMIKWQIKPFAPKDPMLGPIGVELAFYLPIPANTSKPKCIQMTNGVIKHIKRPDIDNLAYGVINAMKTIIYKDDSQIIRCQFVKMYGEPKIVVRIHDLANAVFHFGAD